MTDEFKRTLDVGWRDGQIIVRANDGSYLPPVTLSVFISNGHAQTYLTADEAALLGKTLLEAATGVIERDERPAKPTFEEISSSLNVLADAAAVSAFEETGA